MTSILLPEFKGVMFFSGYRGSGKTFLAAHAELPENIAFFDFDEGKGEGLHNQLDFGYYKPVEENEPLKRADMFFWEVANLEQGRYTTAIIDNVLPIEKAIQLSVFRDAKKWASIYGYKETDILADHYGKARGITNDLIGDAITKPLHSKGIKLIIITSHVKDKYNVPGKMVIDGRDRWQVLSILTLILVDGDTPPIPSAIVQKEQLGKISVNTEDDLEAIMRGEVPSHQIIKRLPPRLPKADWQSIRWYMFNPVDLVNLAEGEKIKIDEAEPFSERLSKEQIAYQLEAIKKDNREREQARVEQLAVNQEQARVIKNYAETNLNGLPMPIKISKIKQAIEAGELNFDGEITAELLK